MEIPQLISAFVSLFYSRFTFIIPSRQMSWNFPIATGFSYRCLSCFKFQQYFLLFISEYVDTFSSLLSSLFFSSIIVENWPQLAWEYFHLGSTSSSSFVTLNERCSLLGNGHFLCLYLFSFDHSSEVILIQCTNLDMKLCLFYDQCRWVACSH